MLTQEEVSSWYRDPVTKEIVKRIYARIQEIQIRWTNGGYPTFAQAELARGIILGLSEIVNQEGDDSE